ncbi:MAG: type II 3-dehydroquinate dehydratase [Gemmatimonadota bacterium]|nr:MAG: type II 3-dehydroquinate dehydratase [Gemmatimonadota bacterium]
MSVRIGVLHGPNLNTLGRREPEVYGSTTLAAIDAMIVESASAAGAEVTSFQSNLEGALVDWIQAEASQVTGWVVNAAGFTHSSVALRDALVASGHPFVEVHISNVFAREEFRHHSVLADVALGVVTGFGPESYVLGMRGLLTHLAGRR